MYSEPESRSSLTLGSGKMVFAWESGDAITVFPDGDYSASQLYKLSAGVGSPEARFHTDNFTMTPGKLYYAFTKKSGDSNVTIVDQSNITVDYAGQTQIGNASTTHLGDYDFLAAGTLCEDPTSVHFQFSHFGATLRLVISFNPDLLPDGDEKDALKLTADGSNLKMMRFTEMELFDKKNTFRQTHRHFNFEDGKKKVTVEGVEKDAYEFRWTGEPLEKMDRFTLLLRSGGPNEEGITRFAPYNDGGTNTKGRIVTYMEVPPHVFPFVAEDDPGNNFLNIIVRGYYEKLVNNIWVKYPVSYVYEHQANYVFESGKAHQIQFETVKPEEFKVTLNVNHNWQHGDVVDNTSSAKSRAATGDPGYDDKIHTPNYIYYIYCHDGKVVLPTTLVGGAKPLTKITATGDGNWSTRKEDNGDFISTYIGNDGAVEGIVTLQKYNTSADSHSGHTAGDCTHHLYVIASASEITGLSATEGQSEESVIRELKYSIPDANQQVFMRDLYSTPWDDDNFEGNLVDAVQDITLYHVAAMVDVKWNTNTTAITSVSANDVKNTGLYLFKPTENAYSTGSYTATNSVEADQNYLGRTVFYLPQFKAPNCQYNIGFNSEAAIPVTFTPDVSKGYTSWLRWLKKKN